MTDDTAADVLAVLRTIAPEIDPTKVDRGAPLAEQLDLDSMDMQRFLVALAARYTRDIPEADVPKLTTVDQIVAYLRVRPADRPR